MRWAISACQPGTVEAKYNVKVLQHHIMYHLVVGALHK